jgi:hypothetical protein
LHERATIGVRIAVEFTAEIRIQKAAEKIDEKPLWRRTGVRHDPVKNLRKALHVVYWHLHSIFGAAELYQFIDFFLFCRWRSVR